MINQKSLLYAGILGLGLILGWTINGWRLNGEISEIHRNLSEAREESLAKARQLEHTRQQLTDSLAIKFEQGSAKQVVIYETIEKEVIRYAENPNAGQCHLPVGWVRNDTEAARGLSEDSFTPSGNDDTLSSFTDIDALRVSVKRSQLYHQETHKLALLQEFVRTNCTNTGVTGE